MINQKNNLSSLKISIVGLGLIGGSLAKSIRLNFPSAFIAAFDVPEVLKKAMAEEVINSVLYKIEMAAESDIIFLALPTHLSLNALSTLAPVLKENTIVTDVSGVKSVFHKKWDEVKQKGIFIGGHPMTGKENGGYNNSDHLLFENAVYIITGKEESSNISVLISLLKKLGARIIFLTPEEHDRVVASVSHLPQLIAVSLINALPGGESIHLAAGGFRDITRIASSPFHIWEPVIKNNKKEILNSLERFEHQIKTVKAAIFNDNIKVLEEAFENATAVREEIPKNSKGFIHPLYDLFVYVNDEPGVLAKLTAALLAEGINIKDIELLKIREGTGGTFRVSFEYPGEKTKAASVIVRLGYKITGSN